MTPLLLQDLLVRGRFVYQARYFTPLLLGSELAIAALFGAAIFGATTKPNARHAWLGAFALVLIGEALSCVASARATTWWNKDYERSASVAALVNRSVRPLVIANYDAPRVLALSFYLDRRLPLRLNMTCTQCTTPPVQLNLADDAKSFRTVFSLQAAGATTERSYLRINPATFPNRASPLNMFLSI
ncbi:MAG: hypothetical protein ABI346_03875, partial [Candidatus Baltobacteraceae bacterium]